MRVPRGRVDVAALVPAEPAALPPRIAAHARPQRVLVVDDNADCRRSARRCCCARAATRSRSPATIREALAVVAASSFRPDLAVLDIGLPHADWLTRSRARLRGGLATPTRCRIIALTGYGREDDRARSRAAPASTITS